MNEKRKVSELRVEGDHHEEKVNEKRKIHNFTPDLRMTPSKQKSMNRESEGDDKRISSHIKYVLKLRLEGDHHEEKVNEKRKIHNFTPELRMTPSKQKSTNRESEGDDYKLRVEGDHHEEKVNEKRKIHNFTPDLRMTPSKQKSMNRESEGDDKRMTPSKEKSTNRESGGDDESKP
ncbi:hypothetical protein Tco_1019508 [Tanacetum coccineum]|uniref:Uncharacterized protein n=1 Tax=Tanacetum coccineum TaxID=301880 RepID=A0ABQ5FYJ2_9ASTR